MRSKVNGLIKRAETRSDRFMKLFDLPIKEKTG